VERASPCSDELELGHFTNYKSKRDEGLNMKALPSSRSYWRGGPYLPQGILETRLQVQSFPQFYDYTPFDGLVVRLAGYACSTTVEQVQSQLAPHIATEHQPAREINRANARLKPLTIEIFRSHRLLTSSFQPWFSSIAL
jgi:hypothetical protein